MCGIAGAVPAEADRVPLEVLERMGANLDHRGPDHAAIEVVDGVGLVHTRLSIVDPSPSGHQPMSSPDGRWWLVYNGELYNHAQLRGELAGPWRGTSDTETLLAALSTWGLEALARCSGMFAFALLDRERRTLVLARDRFGIKPLYWTRHAGGVLFASEISALLAAGVPRRARPDVLRTGIELTFPNGDLTPLDGVHRVMPGTILEIDVDRLDVRERRWFDPTEVVDPEWSRALAAGGREAALAQVEERLRAAIRSHLLADVPVGTLCSGGIDSSLVTAFAQQEHGGPVAAYNASIVDQPDRDESDYARAVADHVGIELRTVEIDAPRWRAGLVPAVAHYEYPLTHEASVPLGAIAATARDDGVKVLLSGEGADELFGGYPWLHQSDWRDFAVRHRVWERPLRSFYRWLQRRGIVSTFRREPRLAPSPQITRYEADVHERAVAAYSHHWGARRRLESKLCGELSVGLPQILARSDKNVMQHSVETRVPFLDPDLAALALNLPLEVRVEPDHKQPLVDLAERYLPPIITDPRPKIGFNFDTSRYLAGAARPEFLLDGRLRETLGEPAEVWAAEVERAQGKRVQLLWTAEVWCRLFLDGDSVESVEQELWSTIEMPTSRTA